jgi:hypothetical protein
VNFRVSGFGRKERQRQAEFRNGSATISEAARTPGDPREQRHCYMLALGCEEENLYPTLRSENGARRFFEIRGLRWWQAPVNGDNSGGRRPSRNMASSQVACVNFLLPLLDIPGAPAAMLRAIDSDVTDVVSIQGAGSASQIEIEWIGLGHALEGPNVTSRGSLSTSVDGFLVAKTDTGRRAYLLEWKYVEEYRTQYLGEGRQGETRRRRYGEGYRTSASFNRKTPLDAWFYEPFYQVMRLRLLADRMVAERELDVSEAKVVVVVPAGNLAYREEITSPQLSRLFPEARSVTDVVRRTLSYPNRDFSSICPSSLANAVRMECGDAATQWGEYLRERYGW